MKVSVQHSIIFLSLYFAACLGLMAVPPPQAADGTKAKPIQVKVGMVSLPVLVTNGRGEYVTDLKQEDFKVIDNGKVQEIAGFATVEEPISVALTLDSSDSMKTYLKTIQNEAIRFVSFLKKDDGLAILSFSDDVILWEPFNLYRKKNPMAIMQIEARGMSAVYEAVWLSLEQVLKHEFGRKALVLFSDGVDNRSQTVTEKETLDLARRTETTIYCIYFNAGKKRLGRFPFPGGGGNKAAREYLAKLSGFSGGMLVDARKIDDLGTAFRKIAQELSSLYSIGYYPNNLQRNGAFHNVSVQLKIGGFTARTREGYYETDELPFTAQDPR